MNIFFLSWEMWFNCFVKFLALLLWFLPSALILSTQYAQSTIYRSYTFCLNHSLSLWFIKNFYWNNFLRGKKLIWEKGNTYWKVLVPLKLTGAILAVLLACTWMVAKKPADVIYRLECYEWMSCLPARFTARNFSFLLEFPTEQELWITSSVYSVVLYTSIFIR